MAMHTCSSLVAQPHKRWPDPCVRTSMTIGKPIRRIAIVGTGVIGASWATYYLSRGFDVVATDPAADAEPNLRKYVDEAWSALAKAGLVLAGASRDRLTFTPSMARALPRGDFLPEEAPGAAAL